MRVSSFGATEVVMLHRVADEPLEPGPYEQMTVSAATLDAFLHGRRHQAPSSLDECLCSRDGRDRLLLTFDDGYAGFTEEVLPVLECHGVPAVVFVTTEFVDGVFEPVQALLARMLNGAGLPVTGQGRVAGRQLPDLYHSLSLGSVAARMRRLRAVAADIGAEVPAVRGDVFMGWEEARYLDRHPLVTIGAHTRTHPRLPRVGLKQLYDELSGAMSVMKQRIGRTPAMLAYPHGANNAIVRAASRMAGYRYAFTTRVGQWIPGRGDPFRIPRNDFESLLAKAGASKPELKGTGGKS